jgi:hypothetical protein
LPEMAHTWLLTFRCPTRPPVLLKPTLRMPAGLSAAAPRTIWGEAPRISRNRWRSRDPMGLAV